MNTERYILMRDVTQKECYWLSRDYKQNEIVYVYYGPTYGCVTHMGVAVTEIPNEPPFFELPLHALEVW